MWINMRAVLAGARGRGLLAGRGAGRERRCRKAEKRGRVPRLGRRGHPRRLLRHRLRQLAARGREAGRAGVRHLRDGLYGNPAPAWRDWNERYFQAVDLAAAHGMRFDFIVGKPGNPAGTLDQLLSVAGGRLRHATEALEQPNEFDHFNGGHPLAGACCRATAATSIARSSANPALRSCPWSARASGRRWRRAGWATSAPTSTSATSTPTPTACPPTRGTYAPSSPRGSAVSGRKPVWATEAGFHNAMRGPRRASSRACPSRPRRST